VQLRSTGGASIANVLHLWQGLVHLRWLAGELDAQFFSLCAVTISDQAAVRKTGGCHLKS